LRRRVEFFGYKADNLDEADFTDRSVHCFLNCLLGWASRMKFSIKLTPTATEHLRNIRKHTQKIIIEGIRKQLYYEPTTQTKNRKPLRHNPLSRWELRIGNYRVFYDVSEESETVEIKAVGFKEHNKLFIDDKEFDI
jgi:mRNA-degrading endonuclease RelE of RelBE toxin-antitoxin system